MKPDHHHHHQQPRRQANPPTSQHTHSHTLQHTHMHTQFAGSSYIAEGVCPMTGGVDVAGRGRAVPVGGRGVRDNRRLARVAGADPDHS